MHTCSADNCIVRESATQEQVALGVQFLRVYKDTEALAKSWYWPCGIGIGLIQVVVVDPCGIYWYWIDLHVGGSG